VLKFHFPSSKTSRNWHLNNASLIYAPFFVVLICCVHVFWEHSRIVHVLLLIGNGGVFSSYFLGSPKFKFPLQACFNLSVKFGPLRVLINKEGKLLFHTHCRHQSKKHAAPICVQFRRLTSWRSLPRGASPRNGQILCCFLVYSAGNKRRPSTSRHSLLLQQFRGTAKNNTTTNEFSTPTSCVACRTAIVYGGKRIVFSLRRFCGILPTPCALSGRYLSVLCLFLCVIIWDSCSLCRSRRIA
jgi:hypothetical protein